jgi:phage replication O-like protein O
MARPQLEDGRTEVANELANAFAKLYLAPRESRVLWAILRQTYGWHKKTDRISFTQFERLTGMNRRHVADALSSLINRHIITRTGNNYKLWYGLQKDYELWELFPIVAANRVKHLQSLPIVATKKIITHSGNTPLPIVATKSLPILANTKAKSIYTKAKEEEALSQNFIAEMETEFPELLISDELKSFNLWWSEGKRKLRRPRFAFRNWLKKAREIKKEGHDNGRNKTKTGIPGNRPTGAFNV